MDLLFRVAWETWEAGGLVLVPIFLVGTLGLYLLLLTYSELGTSLWKANLTPLFNKVQIALQQGDTEKAINEFKAQPSIVRDACTLAIKNRELPESSLRQLLNEKLSWDLYRNERYLPLIQVAALASPLLGLLGTVTGLVHTFIVMNEYGLSNPGLLADGISEALVATQSGLVLAILLVLVGKRLEDRVHWIQSQIEHGITMMLNQFYRQKSKGSPLASAQGGP